MPIPSTPRSPQWSRSLRFPPQERIRNAFLNHTRHMRSPSTPRSPQWSPKLRFPQQEPKHHSLINQTEHMSSTSKPRSPQWSPYLRFPNKEPIHKLTTSIRAKCPAHLHLGLPSGLLPSGFPTKSLYSSSPHPYAPMQSRSTPRSPQCSPSLRFPNQEPIRNLSSPIRAKCTAHLTLGVPSCLLPSTFPHQQSTSHSPHPYTPHVKPIYP